MSEKRRKGNQFLKQNKKERISIIIVSSLTFAFMVYLDLKKDKSNESVVPVFWKENYFTLFPGEERTVSVWCYTSDLNGQKAKVVVGG